MFPRLSDADIARIRRFGTLRYFARGERLFAAGEPRLGMFVVLKGTVTISQRDGLGHVAPVATQGPGQFLAEVSTLSGGHALVDGHADEDVETLLVPSDQLRALIIAEADLGERIVRALILRRVALIQAGGSGPVLIGEPMSPDVLLLQSFLERNGYPYHVVDAEHDAAAAVMLEQYGTPTDAVLAICPNGSVLLNPSEEALARCLGMLDSASRDELFDVVVVGAGPAGWQSPSTPLGRFARRRVDAGRSADRRARAHASRITLAFPPAYPVGRLQAAHSFRRRSLARRS
jgi:thioredoxin reductase (NADPH)